MACDSLLRDLVGQRSASDVDPADAILFTNVRGQQLTRFGCDISYASTLSRQAVQRRRFVTNISIRIQARNRGCASQVRSRLRHDQPVARSRQSQYDDALRSRGYRSQTSGAVPGISGRAATSPRWAADDEWSRAHPLASEALKLCGAHSPSSPCRIDAEVHPLHISERST
jgi:hypothetical protein